MMRRGRRRHRREERGGHAIGRELGRAARLCGSDGEGRRACEAALFGAVLSGEGERACQRRSVQDGFCERRGDGDVVELLNGKGRGRRMGDQRERRGGHRNGCL